MPHFPPVETPYKCAGCCEWFEVGQVFCSDAHRPGTCCHRYERRVASVRSVTIRSARAVV